MSVLVSIKNESKNDLPKQQRAGDAGFDLQADEEVDLVPFKPYAVSVGLRMEIPNGRVGMVCPRSGLSLKGVTVYNAPGIIDSSYRGVCKVILMYIGEGTFHISVGDRIAQLLIVQIGEVIFIERDSLSSTERGEGGFGHTGV